MSDLYFDLTTGDLVIENHDLAIQSDRVNTAAQMIYTRLRIFQGEWYLNESIGLPYLQKILKKNVDKSIIDGYIVKEIQSIDEVDSVTEFDSYINTQTRTYHCAFVAKLTTGENVPGELNV